MSAKKAKAQTAKKPAAAHAHDPATCTDPTHDHSHQVPAKGKKTKSEGLVYSFDVEVPADYVSKRLDAKLAQLSQTTKIPGFRPGKVPAAVVKQRYGQQAFADAIQYSINQAALKVLAENDLRPATQPKVDVKSMDEGQDLAFSMTVEVLPEIKKPNLSGIKLTKLKAEADQKEIDETLGRLAEQNKTSKPAAKKSASGDIVVIDFVGSLKGEEFPGGKGEDFHLELGSKTFIEGFEDQLVGKSAGDKVAVKVTFPEAYHAPNLAGQPADFAVTVKEVRQAEPMPVSDDLAKKLGFDKLDALKDFVKSKLSEEFDFVSRTRLKRELFDALEGVMDFEVPPSLLKAEMDSIAQQMKQAGEKSDDAKETEKLASRRVRLGLLLSEVGREAKIVVTERELEDALIRQAQQFPGREREVFEFYRTNAAAVENLRAPIFEEKVVDHILAQVKVEEKSISKEELLQQEGDTLKKPAVKKPAKK